MDTPSGLVVVSIKQVQVGQASRFEAVPQPLLQIDPEPCLGPHHGRTARNYFICRYLVQICVHLCLSGAVHYRGRPGAHATTETRCDRCDLVYGCARACMGARACVCACILEYEYVCVCTHRVQSTGDLDMLRNCDKRHLNKF